MKKILFVCTGNICRSPTADAVLRHKLDDLQPPMECLVDSAGMQGFHAGEPPDSRAIKVAARHNITMNQLRARKVVASDFNIFDLILAMDRGHLQQLQGVRPDNAKAEIALFLDYAGNQEVREVPDPYYGSMQDFEMMFNLIDAGATAMLKRLTS